jgi:hypothetical protein
VKYIQEKGLFNSKNVAMPPNSEQALKQKTGRAASKDRQSPTARAKTERGTTPLFELNLKFNDKMELLKYYEGDDLKETARVIAQRHRIAVHIPTRAHR